VTSALINCRYMFMLEKINSFFVVLFFAVPSRPLENQRGRKSIELIVNFLNFELGLLRVRSAYH
jgi:hypothetical protein